MNFLTRRKKKVNTPFYSKDLFIKRKKVESIFGSNKKLKTPIFKPGIYIHNYIKILGSIHLQIEGLNLDGFEGIGDTNENNRNIIIGDNTPENIQYAKTGFTESNTPKTDTKEKMNLNRVSKNNKADDADTVNIGIYI